MVSSRNNPKVAGFTLIELLFVTPMVILIVAVMVGFAISLTGDALVARERVNAAYLAQNALDRIENDVRLSSTILATSGTLPSPQGRNNNFNGTQAFSAPAEFLVLEQYATTTSQYEQSRKLVFYNNQPYPCGNANEERNTVMRTKVIYYLDGSTLKRRVVVPAYASGDVCATPWQRNSCKNGLSDINQCRATDETIAENVSEIVFTYYELPADSSPVATPADTTRTVHTDLTINRSVAGTSFDTHRVMRASKFSIE